MSAIFVALLAAIAIGVALRPLFEPQAPLRAAAGVSPHLENLLSAREAAYAAIKDLEADHAMGKLSDADYQTLRTKYETKALAILQQLDAARKGHKKTRLSTTQDTCAQCGTPFAPDDRFCAICGALLKSVCPQCGAVFAEGDRFCAHCGAALLPQHKRGG